MFPTLGISIREITYSDGISLRAAVLKPNPAKVSAGLVQYEDNGAVHLGADVEGQLVAVASFTPFAEDGTRDLTSINFGERQRVRTIRGRVSAVN